TDAHAWVEVYFPTVGWVPFDPQAAERYDEQSWTELLTEGHWDLALKQTARQAGWLVLLGIIAFLAIAALVDPVQALRDVLPSRSRTPLERLSREYAGFYQMLLRRLKVRPEPWLTPREAIESINGKLTARSRLDPLRLMAFNERFYQLRYDVRPRWSEVEELRKELRGMRRRLKRRR
ncbi:MAG: transglutaminase-like domain-containing protein, partial [Armatimonadia bacterium]